MEYLIIRAANGETKTVRVFGLAYAGGKMKLPGWRFPVVVDLAGLRVPAEVPLLTNHENRTASRVGIVRATIENNAVFIDGEILSTSGTAQGIVEQAKAGGDWQLSIGADGESSELVKGRRVVNGQTLEGPFIHVTASLLREISVVPVGADAATRMKVAAQFTLFGGEDMDFTAWCKSKGYTLEGAAEATVAAWKLLHEADVKASAGAGKADPPKKVEDPPKKDEDPPKKVEAAAGLDIEAEMKKLRDAHSAEIKRIAAIRSVCGEKYAAVEAQAIGENWDESRTKQAVELADLRASYARAPGILIRDDKTADAKVLEAALCLRHSVGTEKFLRFHFHDETLNRADQLRHLRLTRIIGIVAARAGVDLPLNENSDAYVRAAFSTNELSGIIGNVANKALAASFQAAEAVVPRIAAKRSHGNFHSHTVYSLALSGDLELVAPDGELKHLSLSEESWTRQVATRGALLSVTRQDMINDELGAFLDNATRMGRKSAVAREKALFTLINATAAGSSFFTTARGNYIEGATTALSNAAAMPAALVKFRKQTGPDGDPVLVAPKILLIPPELEKDALDLFESEFLIATGLSSMSAKGTTPSRNIYRGKFAPAVSPWMSDTSLTGYSLTAWILLASPDDVPAFEIAYLNGVDVPVVEYFGMDTNPNVLGVTWRCYYDFGVALAEYRGGLKSKGSA